MDIFYQKGYYWRLLTFFLTIYDEQADYIEIKKTLTVKDFVSFKKIKIINNVYTFKGLVWLYLSYICLLRLLHLARICYRCGDLMKDSYKQKYSNEVKKTNSKRNN